MVSFGADSCFSSGHGAWLTPLWKWNAPSFARRTVGPVIRPRSSSMKNACLLEDKTRKTACNVRSWLYVREESKVTCQVPASPLPLVRCPINHSAAQAGDYEVSTNIRGND